VTPMPQVSVIIPTRDRLQFLSEAVASVAGQSFGDWELLLVNDGVSALPKNNDPRIRVFDNLQRGAVSARNLGVAHARGSLIAFLDDDDTWIDAGHLAAAAKALQQDAFFFADGIMKFPGESSPRVFARDADATSLEQDNTILISAVCYRRALHDELGPFDEALPYYWDWDWYLRVARAGHRLVRRTHTVVDIRIHPQNMSGDSNAQARRENLDRFAGKHGIGPLVLKNHADFSEAE
jgi:glycosyltransferase involved in cell wall biosynthesis